jgi:hypothetical protein
VAGFVALVASRRQLKQSLSAKNALMRFSRRQVELQKSIEKKLEDGRLDDDEVIEFAAQLKALLDSDGAETADRKKAQKLFRAAGMRSSDSRLLKEIAFEVAAEAKKQKVEPDS